MNPTYYEIAKSNELSTATNISFAIHSGHSFHHHGN